MDTLLTTSANAMPASAMPASGRTHVVRMRTEGASFVFSPARLTIKQGDAVRWVMESGAPHNVAFMDVTGRAKAQLGANMPEQLAELIGKMLMEPNEDYVVSFAGVPPGTYEYVCQPHAAMRMLGVIVVEP